MLLALNMMDVARQRGLQLDTQALSQALGCPVVETVAIQAGGHAALVQALAVQLQQPLAQASNPTVRAAQTPEDLQHQVRALLAKVAPHGSSTARFHPRLDAWLMHPVWGLLSLAVLLFLMFQAVFAWAQWPMEAIRDGVAWGGEWVGNHLDEGPLRSLMVEGVFAGVGSVLVFLPQILILFAFILVLEDSGYLPRAAFLLDGLMGKVGLSGRAFIPLLSSFACAVPGIMATRSITHWRDRLVTIMVAPLMTCSARLPVYTLLLAAFVPERQWGGWDVRGLVLFGLYVLGVVGAMAVAWVLKRTWLRSGYQPLMLELPPYRWPSLRNLGLGLWERARVFLQRVGTLIFALMVVLWFLSSWPAAPAQADQPAITYSLAGQMGQALALVFSPLGWNWQICVALVPGMAAREVVVGALASVYAVGASDAGAAQALAPLLAQQWPLPTALSLLAWFVFAPQCLSTLATVKRETNSWRYPALMAGYLFGLAYLAAFLTYRTALWLNL